MISIVIPLYNKAAYLSKTIQSVVDQTFTQWELIIVNDGSTDDSEELAAQFEDPRIRIYSQENQGVSVARNKGIKMSKYDWVALLDADDWWDSSFLETIWNTKASNPNHKVFCSGRVHWFSDKQQRYTNRAIPKDGNTGVTDYFLTLVKGLPAINCSNNLIAKELLERHTFDPRMSQFEDHELWFRMLREQEIMMHNAPLSFYNKLEQSQAKTRVILFENMYIYLASMVEQLNLEFSNVNQLKYARKFLFKFALYHRWKTYSGYSRSERNKIKHQLTSVFKFPKNLLIT